MGLFGNSSRERAEKLCDIAEDNPQRASSHVDELIGLLEESDVSTRAYAAYALGFIAREHPGEVVGAVDALTDCLDDSSQDVRDFAIKALQTLAYEYSDRVADAVEHRAPEYLDDILEPTPSSDESPDPDAIDDHLDSADITTEFDFDDPLAARFLKRVSDKVSKVTTQTVAFEYDDFDKHTTLARTPNADLSEASVTRDAGPDRVPLKEPRIGGSLTDDVLDDFAEEVYTWQLVDDHHNVVTVHAWGTNPHPWLAIEYVPQGDLDTYRADTDIPIDEALWISEHLADAVQYAHHRDVHHLDLKPTNILLSSVGDTAWPLPKISDWGLAQFLGEHSGSLAAFTPEYAAPEQFASDSRDHRTDLYQLGVVLYELLAGVHPFPDRTHNETEDRLNQLPTPPSDHKPSLPVAVDDLILTLLAPDKADRTITAGTVRQRLHDIRVGSDIEQNTTAGERARLHATMVRRARSVSFAICRRDLQKLKDFLDDNPEPVAAEKHDELRSETKTLENKFKRAETTHTASGDETPQQPIDENSELYVKIGDLCERVEAQYN